MKKALPLLLAVILVACASTPTHGAPVDPWAAAATDNTLVTDPTPLLSAEEITFLRDVARDTWNLLSGTQLNQTTSLLRSSVTLAGKPGPTVELAAPTPEEEYTNPALVGNWLTSIVAARDLGLISAA